LNFHIPEGEGKWRVGLSNYRLNRLAFKMELETTVFNQQIGQMPEVFLERPQLILHEKLKCFKF